MVAVPWLVLVFMVSTWTSYLLWCLDRLPRLRVVLALIAVPCFLAAVGIHGFFLSAPPMPTAPPPGMP